MKTGEFAHTFAPGPSYAALLDEPIVGRIVHMGPHWVTIKPEGEPGVAVKVENLIAGLPRVSPPEFTAWSEATKAASGETASREDRLRAAVKAVIDQLDYTAFGNVFPVENDDMQLPDKLARALNHLTDTYNGGA